MDLARYALGLNRIVDDMEVEGVAGEHLVRHLIDPEWHAAEHHGETKENSLSHLKH